MLSCGDVTGPTRAPLLAIGERVAGHVAGGDTPNCRVVLRAGDVVGVSLLARTGEVRAEIVDSAGAVVGDADVMAASGAPPHPPALLAPRTAVGYGTRVVSGGPGDFRLALDMVHAGPAHHAARVAVGEMVSGESLDGPYDVDELTMTGTAGQELSLLPSRGAGDGGVDRGRRRRGGDRRTRRPGRVHRQRRVAPCA